MGSNGCSRKALKKKNIHLHVYFPANKEKNEPNNQGYPEVSGHPQEHLVKDGSNMWWLVVTGGNRDLVGDTLIK